MKFIDAIRDNRLRERECSNVVSVEVTAGDGLYGLRRTSEQFVGLRGVPQCLHDDAAISLHFVGVQPRQCVRIRKQSSCKQKWNLAGLYAAANRLFLNRYSNL